MLRQVLRYQLGQWEESALTIDKLGNVSFKDRMTLPRNAKQSEPQTLVYLPALFDTHTHGMNGFDFSTATSVQQLQDLMAAYANAGVSYVMATLVSLSLLELKKQLALINDYIATRKDSNSANLVGVHLEGPWIAHNCRGAHAESALQPEISLAMFKDVIACAPLITEWKLTLAPDVKGAIEFIKQSRHLRINNRDIHVQVFIGHTNATPDLLDEVEKYIPVNITHLGNANCETATRSNQASMNNLTSNVVKWALNHPDTGAELIVDGEHLSSEFVKLVLEKLKYNIILVTDSLSPAGQPDGAYMLGSLPIVKKGSKITLAATDKIAGSAATLGQVIEKYFQILSSSQFSQPEILDLIYFATILNPRKTAVSRNYQFNDSNNGVLLDLNSGQIVLSICNGRVLSKVNHNETQQHPFFFNLSEGDGLAKTTSDINMTVHRHGI